jgi:hypothetical protein
MGATPYPARRSSVLSRISLSFLGLLAAALLFASPAGARPKPTPTPSPTVAPVADPAITKLARQQFLAWQIGTIDKTLYSPDLLAKATDEKIADVSRHIAPLGALISLDYVAPFTGEGFPTDAKGYIYQMNCSNGKIFEEIVLTGGKIGYLYFRDTLTTEDVTAPAGTPPPPTSMPLPPIATKRLAR